MIKNKLFNYQRKRRVTFLGVGPMSLNCVDTSIKLANKYEIPIFLIASRRQIECQKFGGGYVNNWSTESFSSYVNKKDKKGKIFLARDHGGPWQNPNEIDQNIGIGEAMQLAKESFMADIKSGFKILHIDPSIDIHSKPSVDEILDRVYELYEFCWTQAQRLQKDLVFEIGTEEQSGGTNTPEELDYILSSLKNFCFSNKLPFPTFVVIQSGTKVLEESNVGSFDSPIRIANQIPAEIQIPKMLKICKQYDVMMKSHNTDYLSNEALSWHPKLGIHSANVAPEFGVVETKAFLKILKENNLNTLYDEFVELSYESLKWQKWIKPNSKASVIDKAVISGHYIFSKPEFIEIKNKATNFLKGKDILLDEVLKKSIEISIIRYLKNFRLI